MSRILLATLGSLGDLNPALAMAKSLEAAGHRVRLAANPLHETATRRQGLEFVPLGRHADPTDLTDYVRSADVRDDALAFVDHANFTQLDPLFDALLAAATTADVLVAAYHVVPAHLVAAKLGIPFLAYTLSPAYLVQQTRLCDRSVAPPPPVPGRWHAALATLRRRAELPRRWFPYAAVLDDPPMMGGLFPTFLLEAGVSVKKLQVMGFPQSNRMHAWYAPDPELLAFCDERTVIFSFGSFVDRSSSRRLFEESVAACRALGMKCLYLSAYVRADDTAEIRVRAFVDHAALFPRAAAIVHHAGLGTLVAACTAGRPMVCVPFLYDQPYHAERMAALVDAPVVPAALYARDAIADALRQALAQAPSVCAQLAALMAREQNGCVPLAQAVATLIDSRGRAAASPLPHDSERVGTSPGWTITDDAEAALATCD